MDEDRIKGAATNLGGKAKDAAGGLVGDPKTQAEGKADQVSGQLQNAYGSAKDAAGEAIDAVGSQVNGFVQEKPLATLLAAVGVGYVLAFLIHRR